MASLQRIGQSGGTVSAVSYGSGKCGSELVASDQFPVGLRVLVVDDDATCLRVLDKMLRRCLYTVTSCSQATVALDLLREKKGGFDVVLSDVHMPDMDGFKLLEYIGLEMDLPVIMMSADGRTSAVMKGIRHGACDYLIKPIREEELKNIWQHVVRKKWTENKEPENSGSLGDNERSRRGNDDSAENASSGNEGTEGIPRVQRKRSNAKEDDGELENEDPSSSKKPRVVWSVELHQQFVSAVNQLGLEKAVPKRILELMNVPGLTRENVASHLQKFRLYLKRLSGVAQQQNVISNPYCGAIEPHVNAGAFGIQNLAPSGSQIPPQTLAALHAELLGQPNSNLIDQPALLQASLHGTNNILVGQGVSYGQPSVTFLPNISKHYQPSNMPFEDVSSGNRVWQQCNNLGPIGSNNLGGLSPQNSNMLLGVLQQQQRNQYSVASEPSHSINVQPSCLVIPSHQSSTSFQAGNSPASVNQNLSYNKSSVIDYTLIPPQSNNSLLNIGQVSGRDLKNMSILTGYTAPRSISPSASSSSVNAGNSNGPNVQNSTLTFTARKFPGPAVNIRDIQGSSYGSRSGEGLDQGPLQNLGFVGKGTIIPSRYAVDEFEAPISNLAHDNVNRVKQEPSMEFVDSEKMGIPLLKQSPNDLMGVFLE